MPYQKTMPYLQYRIKGLGRLKALQQLVVFPQNTFYRFTDTEIFLELKHKFRIRQTHTHSGLDVLPRTSLYIFLSSLPFPFSNLAHPKNPPNFEECFSIYFLTMLYLFWHVSSSFHIGSICWLSLLLRLFFPFFRFFVFNT